MKEDLFSKAKCRTQEKVALWEVAIYFSIEAVILLTLATLYQEGPGTGVAANSLLQQFPQSTLPSSVWLKSYQGVKSKMILN